MCLWPSTGYCLPTYIEPSEHVCVSWSLVKSIRFYPFLALLPCDLMCFILDDYCLLFMEPSRIYLAPNVSIFFTFLHIFLLGRFTDLASISLCVVRFVVCASLWCKPSFFLLCFFFLRSIMLIQPQSAPERMDYIIVISLRLSQTNFMGCSWCGSGSYLHALSSCLLDISLRVR
jgi:hypothetical protein